MKEHPILFSTPMVQAILEGRKTQTRRVIKAKGLSLNPLSHDYATSGKYVNGSAIFIGDRGISNPVKCPYGQVGDKLWVRETWHPFKNSDTYKKSKDKCLYKVDGQLTLLKWKPSIFMPRWASRITLEITDIRVQRLWEITDEDAKAEGIGATEPLVFNDSYKDSYAWLWDKINKKHVWILNEFVWVISFKRV